MIRKLIVIEGADGVGKATQSNLLLTNLRLYFSQINRRLAVLKISFPNYEADSSYFVKKFLSGNFPKNNSIRQEAYAVSASYALDRYLTWNSPIPIDIWEDFCHMYSCDIQLKISYADLFSDPSHYGFSGCVVIADRYIQSNWMYQASRIIIEYNKWFNKLEKDEEIELLNNFIDWSLDLEVKKFGLPGRIYGYHAFYLSLSEEIAKRNRMKRYNNLPNAEDILEKDDDLQSKVRNIADILCEKKYMEKIICYNNSLMLSENEIQNIILEKVKFILCHSEE